MAGLRGHVQDGSVCVTRLTASRFQHHQHTLGCNVLQPGWLTCCSTACRPLLHTLTSQCIHVYWWGTQKRKSAVNRWVSDALKGQFVMFNIFEMVNHWCNFNDGLSWCFDSWHFWPWMTSQTFIYYYLLIINFFVPPDQSGRNLRGKEEIQI